MPSLFIFLNIVDERSDEAQITYRYNRPVNPRTNMTLSTTEK